ncbi:MAG: hypothetical protein IPK81_07720 [Rhodospirillales bacterium]|nr:hypothetical protein [Rhodospirillales bacterium]QQS14059.1 MAG: hypothetical protein IPK81_07720 [Rhodospirillales bacterium]
MLSRLRDYFFPPPIEDVAALRRFLSGEASYIAQRATYEFSRNTLAWFGQHHFGDDKFNEAFAVCRWESYAAILAGMVVLTRGHLLSAGVHHDALPAPLTRLYAEALGEYPVPAHRPEGWRDIEEALLGRLRALGADARPEVRAVAAAAATRAFETLPVLSRDKDEDRRVITGAVTFGMISFADRLRTRVDAGSVVERLDPARPSGS